MTNNSNILINGVPLKGDNGNTIKVAASNASIISKSVANYVCDGTSDDVEIQTAINSLDASNGGIVQLSEGTFNISAKITITNANVTLIGSGGGVSTTRANSVLSQINNANLDYIVYSTGYNCKFIRFIIYGNQDNNTTTIGISTVGNSINAVFQDINVYKMPSHGFLISSNGYAIGCYSELNVDMGWRFIGTENFVCFRCNGQGNGNSGFYMNYTSKYISLVGCMIDSNGATSTRDGVYIQDTYFNTVQGCFIQSNSRHGIILNGGGHHNISNNMILDSGILADNTYSAILMQDSIHNIIHGNTIALDRQALNPNYGVEETGTSDYNNVGSNDISGCQTAQLALIGANTLNVNNILT